MLTSDGSNMVNGVSELIWHRHVLLKVSILAWRLFCNKLPTKANLVARGMLGQDAQLCVAGCGEVETAQHLFVSCPIFSKLWHHVRAWIGVSGVDPIDVSDHCLQFTYLTGGTTTKRSFMHLVWVLWTERNNRQFNNTETNIHQLFEKIQINSYRWLKATNAVHVLGVHN